MRADPPKPPSDAAVELTVSVRRLCAFAAQSGDLDLRFTPAPSALEGMAAHRRVQGRRPVGYEAEVALDWRIDGLRIRGRADGFDPHAMRLEEIKTCRGPADAVKPNQRALHRAQARAYAAMLCEARQLPSLRVALVYFDLETETETLVEEALDADTLRQQFQAMARAYLGWARSQAARGTALGNAMRALPFPRPAFRPGQHELSRRIYQASAAGRCLLAQAPTGIGKTLASLYPMLKAKAEHRIDKVFFLTAKTPGRAVALDALRELGAKGAHDLRVLEIEARESACVHPGAACHGEACPLARGFYDRLPAARDAAAGQPMLDRSRLSKVAAEHAVCPYFLAQEMAHWCDVIVADFNYYFHPSAYLYVLAREEEWQVSLLVDEAHNLPDRARAMYSAELTESAFDAAQSLAPVPASRALKVLRTEWRRAQAQCEGDGLLDEMPDALGTAVRDASACLAEHFGANPQLTHGPLHELFFEVLQFSRLAESFDGHSVLDFSPDGDARRLALRNLIPAPFLRSRFAAARSVVCFSGTLSPFEFYRDTLGLPPNTATVDIASPFDPRQLQVRLAREISTRLEDRPHSLTRLVDILATQYAQRPGNYLAFFSSFDYLDLAAAALSQRHPAVPTWRQRRGMRMDERNAFVDRFREAGGSGIGFAVLGGIFGEGVDLPGEQLVGAFIATLGLPQHDALNERMRDRMEKRFGNGYEYTYLYPGIRKVVQAAGRVIRSESDEGVLWLLDDRFARPEVARLLPDWWAPRSGRT